MAYMVDRQKCCPKHYIWTWRIFSMESTKTNVSTFSYCGSLCQVYSEINKHGINSSVIIQFKFEVENAHFSTGLRLELPIIAQQKAVCYSVKSCFDAVSSLKKTIFVFGTFGDSNISIFQLENDLLEVIGKFSLNDTFSTKHKTNDLPDSQICTQVFSTLRTQTETTISVPEISHQAVIVLDGPIICVVSKGAIYLSPIIGRTPPESVETVSFSEFKLPTHFSELCLLWVSMWENHVIFLGTMSEICRHDINIAKPQINTNTSTTWSNCYHGNERQLIAFRIDILEHGQQRTQTFEHVVEEISSVDFIPNIYSSIIVCAIVRNYQPSQRSNDNGDAKIPTQASEVYICTKLQQLVYFKNGQIQKCVTIPTKCAAEIKEFETFSGQMFIAIWSSDRTVILINEASFQKLGEKYIRQLLFLLNCNEKQVVRVINDVDSMTVDDFVCNGADQLLLLTSSSPDVNEGTLQFGSYLLTDCEGINVKSHENYTSDKETADESSDSLRAATEALQTRQQVAYQSLHEAERLAEKKKKLIQQTCAALGNMCLGEQSNVLCKEVNTLVLLLGQNNEASTNKTSACLSASKTTLPVSHAIACSQRQTPSDTQTVLSPSMGLHTSALMADSSNVPPPGPDRVVVLGTWHRLMAPDAMIVGVKVHNLTHSAMDHIHVILLELGEDPRRKRDTTHHSKAFCIRLASQRHLPTLDDSPAKKPRRQKPVCAHGVSSLHHDNTCHVVTHTVIPTFDYSSIKTFTILLSWSSSRTLVPAGDLSVTSTDDSAHTRIHTKDCGRIELSAGNICQPGPYWINVGDLLQPDVDMRLVLCLALIQQTWTLEVTCLFSGLVDHLPAALESLGFTSVSQLPGYICEVTGQLLWTRVNLRQHGKNVLYMDVSTRNDAQLFLLIHALYAKLPDDVLIKLTNEQARSAAISDSAQCLSRELTITESNLRELLAAGSCPDLNNSLISNNGTLARTMFERRREGMVDREQSAIDKTMIDQFLQTRREMREKTDDAIRILVNVMRM